MKKTDITIGGVYTAKVSGKLTQVRIDSENANGGWDATNLATKKSVRIATARRLRTPANAAKPTQPADPKTAKARKDAIKEIDQRLSGGEPAPGGDTAATAPAEAKGNPKATTEASGAKNATQAKDGAAKRDHTTRPNAKASAKTGVKRMSLLDAAAEVLAKSDEPMGARQLVEAAVEKKLWTPGAGKTPHATLYAAIIREIARKGSEARFEKVDRGRFQRKGA